METKEIMTAGIILVVIALVATMEVVATNQQIVAKSHNPLAKVGKKLKQLFGDNDNNDNNNNNNDNHNDNHNDNDNHITKSELRDENAALKTQIQQLKLQQNMTNSNNLTATNPLAKVGTALRNMFKTNTPLLPPTPTTPTTTTTGIPKNNFTTTPTTTTTGIPKNNFTLTWKPLKLSDFAKNGGGR